MDPQLFSLLQMALPAFTALIGTISATVLTQRMARGTAKMQTDAQRAIALDARKWERRVAHVQPFRTSVGRIAALYPRLAARAAEGDIQGGDHLLAEMQEETNRLAEDLSFRAAGLTYPALAEVAEAFAAVDITLRNAAINASGDPEAFKAVHPTITKELDSLRHVVISLHAVTEAYVADDPPPALPPGVRALAASLPRASVSKEPQASGA